MNYMISGEMEALVLAHPRAIQRWRELMGPTKPTLAQTLAPGSIRGLHGLTNTRNSVHGSGQLLSGSSVCVGRETYYGVSVCG